jgi:hypothetical protein
MKTYHSQAGRFIIRIFENFSFTGSGVPNYCSRTNSHFSWSSMKGPIVAMLMCGFATGCITDATSDLTKAPFDASTELTDATTGSITKLTDGTTQASTDLTEPTREFLSSTTPGAWFHADGTLNPDHKKIAFVVLNFDNLQEDMAHGGGEYLVSYSMLVGVPPNSRESFMKSAQSQYGYIFQEGQSRPETLRRLIKTLHSTSSS